MIDKSAADRWAADQEGAKALAERLAAAGERCYSDAETEAMGIAVRAEDASSFESGLHTALRDHGYTWAYESDEGILVKRVTADDQGDDDRDEDL